MYINLPKLTHLPVVTQSGIKLGRIYDIKLDIPSQMIVGYLVRPSALSRQNFLIKPSQVVKITAEEIVVEDATLKEKTKETRPLPVTARVVGAEE